MCRLGHKKSRKGCLACKKRRVKCDEQAPCRNCVRRGEECSLLAPSPTSSSEKNTLTTSTSEEWLQDLGLMRHFVKETVYNNTLGTSVDIQRLWQDVVTDEALNHPLRLTWQSRSLMHGLLALAALHIVHTRPAEAEHYLRICDNHQTKALEKFRSILSSEITPEMSTPMFALASAISISSMARSTAAAMSMPGPRYVDADQIAEVFLLTSGVRDVVKVCHSWIKSGPLGPMLVDYTAPPHVDPQLPDSVNERLAELHHMIESTSMDENELKIYEDSLKHMKQLYRTVKYYSARGELFSGHVFTWMTSVPSEMINLIRTAQIPALILLADFAACSLSVDHIWYATDWGYYCLEGIDLAISDENTKKWLEWPKTQAKDRMAILRPRTSVRDIVSH